MSNPQWAFRGCRGFAFKTETLCIASVRPSTWSTSTQSNLISSTAYTAGFWDKAHVTLACPRMGIRIIDIGTCPSHQIGCCCCCSLTRKPAPTPTPTPHAASNRFNNPTQASPIQLTRPDYIPHLSLSPHTENKSPLHCLPPFWVDSVACVQRVCLHRPTCGILLFAQCHTHRQPTYSTYAAMAYAGRDNLSLSLSPLFESAACRPREADIRVDWLSCKHFSSFLLDRRGVGISAFRDFETGGCLRHASSVPWLDFGLELYPSFTSSLRTA
ncbi:hypothetical protein LIA77_08883 [Sarocladium implicatum]|nr:hypothetical protein LIA77_08883 [Sarocladium implicatum]